MPVEIGGDGLMHPVIGGALVQGTGGDDRPDSFAEITSARTAGALGHVTIHDHETQVRGDN